LLAVVTLTLGANEPRYPSLKGIMQAKQKPVEQHALADLGLSADDVRPTQSVTEVRDAPERKAGEVVEDGGSAADRVVQFLKEAKVV
jgi:electron transfer flavoprotein beta subunit